tara:strand:+ start:3375 stop:3686 length:312 start_codon:yes stop_codon:yes gene_type:complete
MAIGEQSIFSAQTDASGSVEFDTHRSQTTICVSIASNTAYVRVTGKATESQTTPTLLTSYRLVNTTYSRTFIIDPGTVKKVTVQWVSNTGSLTCDAFVDRVRS